METADGPPPTVHASIPLEPSHERPIIGSMEDRERRPDLWPMLLLALPLAAADMATWLMFGVACGLGENATGAWADLCDPRSASPVIYAPALGPVALAIGVIGARRRRSLGVFWWGLACAVAAGAAVWVLYGDPAGHFSGLLT